MKKLTKIIPLTFLAIILLLLGLFWFVGSDFGQNYITKKIEKYLCEKLKTKVKVDKIRFDFPNWVSVENLEIEDKAKQNIINSKRFYASINMLDLIDNKLTITKIELENAKLNVTKEKEFNFDFIIDAFASKDTAISGTPPLRFEIGDIHLKNLSLAYSDKLSGTTVNSTVGEFKTKFSVVNPEKNIYHLANSKLISGKTSITLTKPSQTSNNSASNKETSSIYDIKVSMFNTSNYQLEYVDLPKKINLITKFNNLILDSLDYSKGINIKKIQFKNGLITYDDNSKPKQSKGLDNAHLALSKLNFEIDNIHNLGSKTSLQLRNGRFFEKSGLNVIQLSSRIDLDDRLVNIQNFKVSTLRSSIENSTKISFGKDISLSSNLKKTQ
ncbi:MAG: hypothetical protein MUF45_03815, partial [Spirosomaceae bacterium]|nr:hypothetical protein [Spirosomataceae bacterium]